MIQKNLHKKSSQQGFTLVELSIVLVIIGLIVGGVLAGQALISAAKIRAQMTQLDQFDAGINAFRAKFDCIPGDCNLASGVADSSGVAITATNAGDGNGVIDYSAGWTNHAGTASTISESNMAWVEMQAIGVVSGTYTQTTSAASFDPSANLAQAKLGGYVMLGSNGSSNYYALANYVKASLATTDSIPADASAAIDRKRDDGIPTTGFVTAIDPTATGTSPFSSTTLTTGASACSATAGVYNTGGKTASCVLLVKVSG